MEQEGQIYLTRNEDKLYDNNYRYRIIAPQFARANHKGTPITVFSNYGDFCTALEIDQNLLMRIIAGNLSCRTGKIKGTGENYLQGTYPRDVIVEIICNYIQEYMICHTCDYPEVKMKYKNSQIQHKCRACGTKYYLDEHTDKEYDITLKFLKHS